MSGCECWSIPSKRAAWGADVIDYFTHNSLQNVHESSFLNDFIKTWLESRRPEMIFDCIRIQEHVAAQATEVLLEFFELDCERLISLQSHTLADLTFLTVNKSQYVRLNSIRAQSGSPEGGHLGFSRSVSIQGGLQSEGGFVPI